MSATSLLKAEEVAERLAVTREHVLKLRRLDPSPLPGINVAAGRVPDWRWRPSVVETFLRNRTAR